MSIQQIAICTDFSENAEAAFDTALEMAEKFSAKLSVIYVLPPVVSPMTADAEWVIPEEPKDTLIIKVENRMVEEYGSKIKDSIDHEFIVLDGHVSTEIINFLEETPVDVVIMGSFGFTGMGLVVFGSVAKRVSHKAPCSVMIVRKREET